jgi:hypothetical protein
VTIPVGVSGLVNAPPRRTAGLDVAGLDLAIGGYSENAGKDSADDGGDSDEAHLG